MLFRVGGSLVPLKKRFLSQVAAASTHPTTIFASAVVDLEGVI